MQAKLWIALAAAAQLCGQTKIDLPTQTRNVDFSGATSTKTIKTGSALPANCRAGEVFLKLPGPAAGQNLYVCVSDNNWQVQTGQTGAATIAVQADGTIVAAEPALNFSNFFVLTDNSPAGRTDIGISYIPENSERKDLPNGYAGLDGSGKLTLPELPAHDHSSAQQGGTIPISGLSGSVPVSKGGTGLTAVGDPDAALFVNPGGDGLEFRNSGTGLVSIGQSFGVDSAVVPMLAGDNIFSGGNTFDGGVDLGIVDHVPEVPAAQTIRLYSVSGSGKLSCLDWLGNNCMPAGSGGSGGLAEPATNGLVARTASGSTAARQIGTANGNHVVVTNGDGVSGNPSIDVGADVVLKNVAATFASGAKQTFAPSTAAAGMQLTCGPLPSTPATGDLACDSGDGNRLKWFSGTAWFVAAAEPAGNGLLVRTASGSTAARQIGTANGNHVVVTNGDGVSGNPSIDTGADVVLKTSATTYSAGAKQTFGASGSTAGVAITPGSDPSSPAAGDVWLNSSGVLKYYANSTIQTLSTVAAKPFYLTYKAAVCQGLTASAAFSLPTVNAPSAACRTGSNTNFAILQFNDTTAQSVQDAIDLPADWTGAIDVRVTWRASANTGRVVWSVQAACAAEASTTDPAWNTVASVVDPAASSAGNMHSVTITPIPVNGCSQGGKMYFKFFRDAANSSDDMSGGAELISLGFTVRRLL